MATKQEQQHPLSHHEKVTETRAQQAGDAELDQELLRIGQQVIMRQKAETFRESWASHWRAGAWSLFISMGLWMEGFDQAIVSFVSSYAPSALGADIRSSDPFTVSPNSNNTLGAPPEPLFPMPPKRVYPILRLVVSLSVSS